MVRFPMFHLAFLILLCGSSAATITTCSKVTENWPNDTNTAQVGCPVGETIQSVTFASFGTSTGSCGTQPFSLGSCNAANSTKIVQSSCLGLNSCSVVASLSLFGDPCPNVDKTLAIQIVCTTNLKSPLISPGKVWNDTSGNRIEAHGGGFLIAQDNNWYWYGENAKTSDLSTHGINCYTSNDLVNWKFCGEILTQTDIKGIPQAGPYVIERPKVVYCKNTGLYVLWFHLDNSNYSLRYVGTATSPTPTGPFTFVRGFQPDGLGSLDMGMYQEQNAQGQHDGPAYLVRSVENQYVGISGLSSDCLNTTGLTSTINQPREGPAIYYRSNRYYLITSHLTGWSPNAMDMWISNGNSLINATWSSIGNPTGDSTTFNSQSTAAIPFRQPNGKTLYIYAGDRWNYPDLLDASYIWLPIEYNGNTVLIPWQDQWELDAEWPGELTS